MERQPTADPMKDEILEAIARNSIFTIDIIHRLYDFHKSYDIIVKACNVCQREGLGDLQVACMMVKNYNIA